jgi:hypothetical protein
MPAAATRVACAEARPDCSIPPQCPSATCDTLYRMCPTRGMVALGAWRCGPRGPEVNRTVVRAQLVGLPPPGIIVAPGRGPAVLVGLHTANHRGRTSPVQKAQRASAARDWTGILRFTVCEQEDPVTLCCADHRQRILSALLQSPWCLLSLGSEALTAARRWCF